MRAVTVVPGQAGTAVLAEVPEPPVEQGAVLAQALALGVCGTDREIVDGHYGWAAEGRERLVLGHESLGRVVEAPAGSGLTPGDLVAGIVRRPDPVPCACCATGDWDMCRNGRYTERGIKMLDGFASERWRIEPDFAVRVDPGLGGLGVLLEPASVLAKAWDETDAVLVRGCGVARTALITGAGPIGLLAAMFAVQRGLDTHVLDVVTEGPKPRLVAALGATYHAGTVADTRLSPDVVIECTGAGQLVLDAIAGAAPGGVVCLTGVARAQNALPADIGALNNALVLGNGVVFGSVNANRRHWELAAAALARADRGWLEGLVTRRVTLEAWATALERRPDDIKVVVEF